MSSPSSWASPGSPDPLPDLLAGPELLERAVGYTRTSLQLVAGTDLTAPTPCARWDLLGLLRHMNDALAAFTEAAEIGYVDLVPVRGADPAAGSGLRGLAVSYTLDGSTLGLANLQDVLWRGVTLRGVDLSEADLRGADLRGATLLDCVLRDVDLAHTKLTGADLRGADLGGLAEDAPRTLRGAIVSEAQAADVCRALGLVVG